MMLSLLSFQSFHTYDTIKSSITVQKIVQFYVHPDAWGNILEARWKVSFIYMFSMFARTFVAFPHLHIVKIVIKYLHRVLPNFIRKAVWIHITHHLSLSQLKCSWSEVEESMKLMNNWFGSISKRTFYVSSCVIIDE